LRHDWGRIVLTLYVSILRRGALAGLVGRQGAMLE
jgi:hypothetical protein